MTDLQKWLKEFRAQVPRVILHTWLNEEASERVVQMARDPVAYKVPCVYREWKGTIFRVKRGGRFLTLATFCPEFDSANAAERFLRFANQVMVRLWKYDFRSEGDTVPMPDSQLILPAASLEMDSAGNEPELNALADSLVAKLLEAGVLTEAKPKSGRPKGAKNRPPQPDAVTLNDVRYVLDEAMKEIGKRLDALEHQVQGINLILDGKK
jgi:hypothetical protein